MLRTQFTKYSLLLILLFFVTGSSISIYAQDCAKTCTYFETADFPDLIPVIDEIKGYIRKNPSNLTPDCNRRLNYLLAVIYESISRKDSAAYYMELQYTFSRLCSSDTAKIQAGLHAAGFQSRNFNTSKATMLVDSSLFWLRSHLKKEFINYNFEGATSLYTAIEDTIPSTGEIGGFSITKLSPTTQELFRNYYQAKANIYTNESNIPAARANFLLAYQFAKANRLDSTEANILNNLGLLLTNEGYYQKAVSTLNETMLLHEQQENYASMPNTLINLSYCYRKMKAYKEAENYASKAVTISIEKGYKSFYCRASGFLARAYSLQNKFTEAERTLRQSIDTARFYKNKIELCYNLRALAEIFLHQGTKIQEARDLAMESRSLAVEINDKGFLASIYNTLGNYYYVTGSYPLALDYTLKSVAISNVYNDAGEIEVANKQLADIYEASGNHAEAIHYYKKYVQIKDSLLNREVTLQTQDLESKYNTQSKSLQIVRLEKDQKEKELQLKVTSSRIRLFFGISIATFMGILLFIYLNRKLSTQKKQVETANTKLKELTTLQNQLFRIIAHDLKSMVFPFNRAGRIMRSYFQKNDIANAAIYAEKLEENAVRISGTINNLLFWSIQQLDGFIPRKEQVLIRETVDEVLQPFYEMIRFKNIDIVNLLKNSDTIYIDKEAFQLIIRNIFSNAVKFTEKASITIYSEQSEKLYSIVIADRGTGMDKDKVKELLEKPLQQTTSGTRGEKGSGIGFSLIKKIVSLNEGELFLESELTKGTTIRIQFKQDL